MSTFNVPLTLLDPEGGWVNAPVHVHELHGRPVLLHFWTERFAYRQARMARLQGLLREFIPRGLQVIGVHTPLFGQEPARPIDTNELEDLVKRLGIHYPVAADDGSMATVYGVTSAPAYLLFGGDLRPIARFQEEESLEEALRPALAARFAPDASAP